MRRQPSFGPSMRRKTASTRWWSSLLLVGSGLEKSR
jgi:hypothetical protein